MSKKLTLLYLSLLVISSHSWADLTTPTEWTEADGSPSVFDPYKVSFTNGTVTDNGDGSISITITGGSGSPGGVTTQVQFNDAGSFGGDDGLVYNKITNNLTISGDVTISGDNITATTNTDRFVFMANGATYAPEAINLGTDTTGNYVDDVTAGRSLTVTHTPGEGSDPDIVADAELYTDTKCLWFEDPVAADDFQNIWVANLATTITGLSCVTDQTVTFNISNDSAAVDGSSFLCNSTWKENTSVSGDVTIVANGKLHLNVDSVSGTPTYVSICWEHTRDD